jgi:hypothetical protein
LKVSLLLTVISGEERLRNAMHRHFLLPIRALDREEDGTFLILLKLGRRAASGGWKVCWPGGFARGSRELRRGPI